MKTRRGAEFKKYVVVAVTFFFFFGVRWFICVQCAARVSVQEFPPVIGCRTLNTGVTAGGRVGGSD